MSQFSPIVFSPPTTTSFPPLIIQARGVAGIASLEVDNGSALTLTVKGDGQVIRVVNPYVARFCLNTGGQWQTIEISANTATIQSTDAITIVAYDQAVVPPLLPSYSPLIPYQFTAPVSFGPNGGFYDGSSGTFANPNTGLKMYQDSNGNGRIELWSGGVLIWSWDAVNGLVGYVVNGAFTTTNRSINWLTGSTTLAQLNVEATVANLLAAVLSVGPLSGDDSELRQVVTAPTGFNAELLLKAISNTTVASVDINASSVNGAPIAYTADRHVFVGHVQTSGTAPTAVAGGNAGTGPPNPVVLTGSTDTAGAITFGTGTGPTGGRMVTVTFHTAYTNTPFILCTPYRETGATGQFGFDILDQSVNGFTFALDNAPAASQANTVYGFSYLVIGH